jgi:hypothetical protein
MGPYWSTFHTALLGIFAGGDVEIRHSNFLSLYSTWFQVSLSELWAKSGQDAHGGGGGNCTSQKKYWTYELRFDKNDHLGILTQRSSTPNETEMVADSQNKVPEADVVTAAVYLHNMRLSSVRAHQDMLRTFYHLIPA